MSRYSYEIPYNQWSGNRSDTLNKWKINYKGSIAKASDLPDAGEFKGDTYNVLEDGSNYMWNGSSWDKLDANVYVGATSQAKGIQGLVPPAETSERNKFLRGDGTYKDVSWSMVTSKPSAFPPETHTHDGLEYLEGVSSNIQEQINALALRISALEPEEEPSEP